MKYLGKFTGKLYSSEDLQNGLILECALQLDEKFLGQSFSSFTISKEVRNNDTH